MKILTIPDFSLVVLIGATGSGKSTFAAKHFKANEILSTAQLRAMIADREKALEVAAEAFELLLNIAEKRLSRRLLTVVDASNLQPEVRKALIALAQNWDAPAIAIVLAPDIPLWGDRIPEEGSALLSHQSLQMTQTLAALPQEGFTAVHILNELSAINDSSVERTPLKCDHRNVPGPFDIIGDVHGCWDELKALFMRLGYTFELNAEVEIAIPPSGRKAIFLGDLVDRGPAPLKCLTCAIEMVKKGHALMLPGNHEEKLLRHLRGKKVSTEHGFQETLNELASCSTETLNQIGQFLKILPSHYVLDTGKLVVAHAGLKERYQGRESGRVRAFALYGATTGERDEYGLPIRSNWALDYWGKAIVVYGHTPVRQPLWINRSLNIDTGCVFGGSLTALRYPELEIVSVPAQRVYTPPKRFLEISEDEERFEQFTEQLQIPDESIEIDTALMGKIRVRPQGIALASEEIRASSVEPKHMVYLPLKLPIIGHGETALQEAFRYYTERGISKLYCREKIGSVSIALLLCRNERIAKYSFGLSESALGICYTETLYDPFQKYHLLGNLFFERLHAAATRSGLWERLESPWVVIEGSLLPFSLGNKETSNQTADLYDWPLQGIDSVRFYPSLLAAAEGNILLEQPINVQEEILSSFRHQDPHLLRSSPGIYVDLRDSYSKDSAQRWWKKLEGGTLGCDVAPLNSPIALFSQHVVALLSCVKQPLEQEAEQMERFFQRFALTHETLRRLVLHSSLQECFNSFYVLKTF